ncbi:MAG: DinB family protein [Roseiflexaceae bacterium]|jgi:hypothetical protein
MDTFAAHIAKLRAFPSHLQTVMASLSEAQLRFKPANEWSVIENIGHLIDIDELYVGRVDRILAEERPEFPRFEPDPIVATKGYQQMNGHDVLQQFIATRQATIDGLSTIEPDELNRAGMHAVYGEMTLLRLVEQLANHDQKHLVQIHDTLAAYAKNA